MVRKLNKILDGLFVGNFFAACDGEILDRLHISAIVSIMDRPRPLFTDRCYLCINAADTEVQSLRNYFPISNKFIHSSRLRGQNVLVHCYMGASRSVTLAIAYLMAANHLSFERALHFVQLRRPVAHPNPYFRNQLQRYEEHLIDRNRFDLGSSLKGHDCNYIYSILIKEENDEDLELDLYPQMPVSSYDTDIEDVMKMVQPQVPPDSVGIKLMDGVFIYEPYDYELFCQKFSVKNLESEASENQNVTNQSSEAAAE